MEGGGGGVEISKLAKLREEEEETETAEQDAVGDKSDFLEDLELFFMM